MKLIRKVSQLSGKNMVTIIVAYHGIRILSSSGIGIINILLPILLRKAVDTKYLVTNQPMPRFFQITISRYLLC